MLDETLKEKLERLKEILAGLETVVVAYSGGVDSTFLLRVAREAAEKVLAVTAISPTYPQSELDQAQRLAQSLGVEHLVVESHEMDNPNFCANPADRCYYCKSELFSRLQAIAAERGFKAVVDGSNAEDAGDFRPGMRAAREYGVRSPLLEAGLTKEEIRKLSRYYNLPTWDKPAMACLSSRIPYGEPITLEKIKQVAEGEAFLRSLGLREVRLRHHGPIARLEVSPAAFPLLITAGTRERIITTLKSLGFTYVTLDLEGFRSGSMNQLLKQGAGAGK
ncbi:MAG: ATP-dependent sacrificial sulfur transferase LarE [Thermanaeromonas sp.]|uniref:ATP-dependent sacrificial sulfur transferase LarE n=1 Tax=Thermanaeromonas sp. TaxID=2003697 RepID=UPI00244074F1|nr:ATP-dependent sacrificial sulfur transferase LarE [Thermanaeromonas sp.]MCG0277059.1 ATP-dependent sacrificial sulfur transferase LarE [Thermanaeromonas sp.]